FFFNDTATTEIYTLSLHDALPISRPTSAKLAELLEMLAGSSPVDPANISRDRKSTRLNSSHVAISYAVFCFNKNLQQRQHSDIHTPRRSNTVPDKHTQPT